MKATAKTQIRQANTSCTADLLANLGRRDDGASRDESAFSAANAKDLKDDSNEHGLLEAAKQFDNEAA